MLQKPVKIEWAGESINTKHYMDITEEHRQSIEDQWYAVPSQEEVDEQFRKIAQGSTIMSKVTMKYFNRLMSMCKVEYAKWTMEELLKSKELVGMILDKVQGSPKTFAPTNTEINNFKRCIQLGGKGYAGYPTQFPLKTVDMVLGKYLPNGGNWYDYSCGWGARLLGALRNGVNYFGTDPNFVLTNQLFAVVCDYFRANGIDFFCLPDESMVQSEFGQRIEIYATGSEVLHHNLEGEMDLCFSSPPYFNLEDYRIGEQSWHEGMSYKQWVDSYLRPTIFNCLRYLKSGGHFVCNIKNFKDIDMEGDVLRISEAVGLNYVEDLKLENINRVVCTGKLHDSSEKCYVFEKS